MAEYRGATLLNATIAEGVARARRLGISHIVQLFSWFSNKSSHAERKLFFGFVVCDRASVCIADRALQLGYEPISRLEYSPLTYHGRPITADSFRWQCRGNCAKFWPRIRRASRL